MIRYSNSEKKGTRSQDSKVCETRDQGEFRTFEDLECWQACRELRLWAAGVCKVLPKEEAFRLRDQMLRAARRTTASVAEGYGRFHYQETAQYCRMARGSVYEVLDHAITAVDESLLLSSVLVECRRLSERCVRLLNGYIRYLDPIRKAFRTEGFRFRVSGFRSEMVGPTRLSRTTTALGS